MHRCLPLRALRPLHPYARRRLLAPPLELRACQHRPLHQPLGLAALVRHLPAAAAVPCQRQMSVKTLCTQVTPCHSERWPLHMQRLCNACAVMHQQHHLMRARQVFANSIPQGNVPQGRRGCSCQLRIRICQRCKQCRGRCLLGVSRDLWSPCSIQISSAWSQHGAAQCFDVQPYEACLGGQQPREGMAGDQ